MVKGKIEQILLKYNNDNDNDKNNDDDDDDDDNQIWLLFCWLK